MVEGDAPAPGAPKPNEDPLLGKVLNKRFQILEPIGAGGMGRVYKALQAPLERLVALKVLNPSYSEGRDPGFRKRFFLEASLTSKLHHPNTITVHDYGCTEDGIYYLVMEYVEGLTLAQLLQREGALPWPRAIRISQQICRSLREAHRMGVVHRDLKPANVMVLNEETDHDLVKVLDFGLVKPFLADAPQPEAELTQAGVVIGSPLYMAPEMAKHRSDPRSDIYSLGVLTYQILTGRPPFQGKESIEVIVKHLKEPPPPLRSLNPEVPEEVAAVVMKCLEKDPARRPQSMDEVLDQLRQAGASLSGAFSGPRPLSPSSALPLPPPPLPASEEGPEGTAPARLGRARLVALGVFALSLVLGLWVVVLARGKMEPPPAEASHQAPLPPPPEPSSPAPEQVVFRISSSPPGAQVSREGRQLGKTPLELSLTKGADGLAATQLTFSLAGYHSATVEAAGEEPEVEIHQALVKKEKAPPVPPRPKRHAPPGYKEDPYQ